MFKASPELLLHLGAYKHLLHYVRIDKSQEKVYSVCSLNS